MDAGSLNEIVNVIINQFRLLKTCHMTGCNEIDKWYLLYFATWPDDIIDTESSGLNTCYSRCNTTLACLMPSKILTSFQIYIAVTVNVIFSKANTPRYLHLLLIEIHSIFRMGVVTSFEWLRLWLKGGIGPWKIWMRFSTDNFQYCCGDWYLQILSNNDALRCF